MSKYNLFLRILPYKIENKDSMILPKHINVAIKELKVYFQGVCCPKEYCATGYP